MRSGFRVEQDSVKLFCFLTPSLCGLGVCGLPQGKLHGVCTPCLEEHLWKPVGCTRLSVAEVPFTHGVPPVPGLGCFLELLRQGESPAYLNALIVCVRDRHGFEATVLAADFCSQQVDDFLYLLHRLRNLLSPQVHLGVRRSGKQLQSPRRHQHTGDKAQAQ